MPAASDVAAVVAAFGIVLSLGFLIYGVALLAVRVFGFGDSE